LLAPPLAEWWELICRAKVRYGGGVVNPLSDSAGFTGRDAALFKASARRRRMNMNHRR